MRREDKIRGKWAVVTGASSGIGLEFCRQLAEMGTNLLMVSNEQQPLEEAAATIAQRFDVRTLPLYQDLTERDCADTMLRFADTQGIEPSLLINNAGIFSFRELTEIPEGKVHAFIDLHVRAVTMLSRAFAERMKRRGEGMILNMSSMSCWMPMPGLSMYSATKAYIRVMSRSLGYEMRDYGVSVTVACPGGIATDLFGLPANLKKLALNLHAIETPERFVHKAIQQTLRGKQQYINGLLNRFSILFIGSLPTGARMQVKRQLLDRNIMRP